MADKRERIENDFKAHPVDDDQKTAALLIRDKGKELALLIVDLAPESREQNVALTNLETAIFWANAAIARNKVPVPKSE